MRETVKVSTVYGPIPIVNVRCDNPLCDGSSLEVRMVGWWRLESQGLPAPTLGGEPETLDFCTYKCAAQALSPLA